MKRIVIALLSCFMLTGFTSCDQTRGIPSETESTTSESTSIKTTAEISTESTTSESTSITTTAEISTESTALEPSGRSSSIPINISLDEVRNDLIKYSESTSTVYYYSELLEKPVKELTEGIKEYLFIHYVGPWYQGEEFQYFMFYSVYVLEFDMDSEIYKNLKPGDTVNISQSEDHKYLLQIASINGQYALCIVAGKEDNEWNNIEEMPDFTIGNTKDFYIAFNGYK